MIIYTYVDQTCVDNFSVIDPDTSLLVGGLSQGDFTVAIYDPTGTDRSTGGGAVLWSIEEKYANSGYYTIGFTPDVEGNWLIGISHATYFPWGKSGNYSVVAASHYSGGLTNDELLAIILSQ